MSLSVIVMGASGRMGTTIANLVRAQGHTLAAVLERPERVEALTHWGVPCGSDPNVVFAQAPGAVVIDFTAPEASLATARVAARNNNPMVVGTTGFSAAQKTELEAVAKMLPLFWAPNMSVGVHAVLEVLPQLVRMLGPDYDIEVLEMHHNRKKDAPSGTALRLAECASQARDWPLDEVACYHREGMVGARPQKEIGIQSMRGGDVVGTHTVYLVGPGERVELTHHAQSRDNFARGALRAAEWLTTQPAGRLYSMADLVC